MKRDWDVVRHLLTVMEDQPTGEFELYPTDFAPVDPERAAYHLRLLMQAGSIEAADRDLVGVSPGESIIARGLTMQGHDLLATLRSKDLWARIRTFARERGIELTADVIKALAAHVLKSLL